MECSFLEELAVVAVSGGQLPPPDAVWPIPLERTVSYGDGTGRAPDAIVRAGSELERYDEELEIDVDWNVDVIDRFEDTGGPIELLLDDIEKHARRHYREYPFVVALGGEHTVTVPLVKAAVAEFGPLGVLHIDAHADLRAAYLGQPHSHACVMHHVRKLTERTVSVGIRSLSGVEAGRIRAEGISVFRAHDIAGATDDAWIERVLEKLPETVYVTVDVDGFDPAVFPGVGTPEPGGLSWRQGLALLRRTFETKRVVAADVVEAVPVPGSLITEFAAARLALKMMLYRRAL